MAPSLIALAGPMHGAVVPLEDGDVSLGRDSSNQLHPADLSLSRRHCLFAAREGRVTLSDLDSMNGTFVNGAPIKTRVLEHGDHVKVGESLFLFLQKDATSQATVAPLPSPDEGELARDTVQLRREDVLYLQSEQMLEAFPPALRTSRTLEGLLRVTRALAAAPGADAAYAALFDRLFELIPAEHAAVVWSDHGDVDLSAVHSRSRPGSRPLEISRTIVRRVIADGVALLSNDVEQEDAFRAAKSVTTSGMRAVLCVPMMRGNRPEGALYVASADRSAALDQSHLELLTAVAGVVPMAFHTVRHIERLEEDARTLRSEVRSQSPQGLIGDSAAMRDVRERLVKAARSDATVLLLGESGTGKERAAAEIHAASARARQPLVIINAAELSETLLESELFGHEKGSFTGAIAQKKGKLELAADGTLFLDEVGDLSPSVQVKLLRVLQEREFTRVGGVRPIKIDVRFIAATNVDLDAAIKRGTFRQDLFYRLNVITIRMPPLRERPEDIPLLATLFADRHARKCKRRVAGLTPEARARLMRYDWPGNVRELENAIERAVVLGSSEHIELDDLPETMLETDGDAAATNYHKALLAAKKRIVLDAFERADRQHAEAARLLGLHPNNLHRLIRQLGLRKRTDQA